jgi:translation initiation factor 6 (eIF-6)
VESFGERSTSLRIEAIAEVLDVRVFRPEVGVAKRLGSQGMQKQGI